jgi:hypothetical protein
MRCGALTRGRAVDLLTKAAHRRPYEVVVSGAAAMGFAQPSWYKRRRRPGRNQISRWQRRRWSARCGLRGCCDATWFSTSNATSAAVEAGMIGCDSQMM